MRTALLVASIVLASLLVPMQPAAAITPPTPTIDLAVIAGGGLLESGSKFSVGALSLLVQIGTTVVVNEDTGSLVIGTAAPLSCTIDSVDTGCSGATLSCDDSSTHHVTAGVEGVSGGSVDDVLVKLGFIFMQCQHQPPTARFR